jgi:hypothetical protein
MPARAERKRSRTKRLIGEIVEAARCRSDPARRVRLLERHAIRPGVSER